MEELNNFIATTAEQTKLTFDRLPDIDLYMDQVIEYLKRQCSSGADNDALSGAMINNYIKDKIIPRATDKRYGKEHLAYLMIIARLKQVLPVKDIGIILSKVPKDFVNLYFDNFQNILCESVKKLRDGMSDEETDLNVLALNFAVAAYVNKVACEIILNNSCK